MLCGGWGGIRTHEGVAPLPVFKTGAFNRSTTHPFLRAFVAIYSNDSDYNKVSIFCHVHFLLFIACDIDYV
jgi:hypothetical protein